VDPSVTGSVLFTFDGASFVDNSAPYDFEGGALEWVPGLGLHTLQARAFSQANGAGLGTQTAAVAFTVTNTPLAVTLASFDARQQGAAVQVSWETASELNSAGFNLYRALAADGERRLLAFVPSAAPGGSAGALYSFSDAGVAAGQVYWYWLEDVDLGGATGWHGPVSVTVEAPTAVTLAMWSTSRAPAVAPAAVLALTVALGGALGALARGWRQRVPRRPGLDGRLLKKG
jgi:hypothetical protein